MGTVFSYSFVFGSHLLSRMKFLGFCILIVSLLATSQGCANVGSTSLGGCPESCRAICAAVNYAATTTCTYTISVECFCRPPPPRQKLAMSAILVCLEDRFTPIYVLCKNKCTEFQLNLKCFLFLITCNNT